MHPRFAILLALGLLGATVGCHHTHGVCDCDLGPIGHNGPPPLAAPPAPLRPVPAQPMPQPPAKLSAATGIDASEKATAGTETQQTDKTASATAAETPK